MSRAPWRRALVRIGDSSQALRQRAAASQFESDAAAGELVRAFVTEHLFVTDFDDDGVAIISVAHEALLSAWDRLALWIRENREFLVVRMRTEQGASTWDTEMRDASYLLQPGKPLDEAEHILRHYETTLSIVAQAFVKASVLAVQEAAAEKVRQREQDALRLQEQAMSLWNEFRETGNRVSLIILGLGYLVSSL